MAEPSREVSSQFNVLNTLEEAKIYLENVLLLGDFDSCCLRNSSGSILGWTVKEYCLVESNKSVGCLFKLQDLKKYPY